MGCVQGGVDRIALGYQRRRASSRQAVEHLDGGGQSGDWQSAEMKAQTDADEAAFMAKWGAVKVPA
jgi:hypothetical protein